MKLSKTWLLLCCFALVSQLFITPASYAKMYTWTDRTGKIRRTYYPPPANQVQRKKVAKRSTTRKQAVGRNSVEIYTTSWCGYCKKAIHFFQQRGIAYTVYNIETDKEAAARKRKLDGRSGVPFAVVNGRKIHGFSASAYEAALNK
ncbi:MAG: hypothetical protein DSY70_02625 [Desulfobulbus sp.]|nr:MAG: hypothetical protein DSY70_02625 [Desulfobulbus sp.]